jgi:hypothetical protein
MSTPFVTPPPVSKTTDTSVEGGLTETQVRLFRLESEILDKIVGVSRRTRPTA